MVAIGSPGCADPAIDPPPAIAFGESTSDPIAGEREGDTCFDLASAHRVCFGERTAVRARPAPRIPAPGDGLFRCEGSGDGRTCTLVRARPFDCAADGTCEQRFPRAPDDGDWECADVDGLVVCRGRGPAAGVVAGPPEPGWICGDGPSGRICVDLAPDVPPRSPADTTYACRFRHEPTTRRVCRPDDGPRLGARCGAATACPTGMSCTGGVCAPTSLPAPSCWTSDDCGEGHACVLATCG